MKSGNDINMKFNVHTYRKNGKYLYKLYFHILIINFINRTGYFMFICLMINNDNLFIEQVTSCS